MRNDTKLSLALATIMGMNAMIGAGIFTAPAVLVSYVGPAGILSYLFVVLAVWCMAFSFARLTQLFPEEGSFYAYAARWGGPVAGVLTSTAYVVGVVIAMGLITRLSGMYLGEYAPGYSPITLGLGALAILTLINAFGGIASRVLPLIALCCTVFPIVTVTLLCFSKATFANLVPFAPYGFTNVLRATQAVIFGFLGFESTASLFPLVENPERNVSRAITYSIMGVSLLYLLFIVSVLMAVPASLFSGPATPLSVPLKVLFPTYGWLIKIVHLTSLVAFLSVLNVMLMATGTLMSSLINRVAPAALDRRVMLVVAATLIGLCAYNLTNIDFFFSLVALFMTCAYVSALSSLFTQPNEWRSIRFLVGFATALLIFGFAVEGSLKTFFPQWFV